MPSVESVFWTVVAADIFIGCSGGAAMFLGTMLENTELTNAGYTALLLAAGITVVPVAPAALALYGPR